MENKYQITKTIRFGLTLKQQGKKHQTHQISLDATKKRPELWDAIAAIDRNL